MAVKNLYGKKKSRSVIPIVTLNRQPRFLLSPPMSYMVRLPELCRTDVRPGNHCHRGANPSYGAEQNGLLASLNSVTKLPYEYALDGISNTQTISPDALGHNEDERADNLVHVLDGYFDQGPII